MIRDASKCLMLNWIQNIEKLDVLTPSQLQWFVAKFNDFEFREYMVAKRTITSLTIDTVTLYLQRYLCITFSYAVKELDSVITEKINVPIAPSAPY